jgi:hypothetical protein
MATTERPLSLEQHKHVEAGVEEDIRNFIQKRFPGTTDIFCQQLYTEKANLKTELIARFRCQAVGQTNADDATEQVFEGFLRLASEDGFQTWSELGGEINAKEINFLNGFKISPRDDQKSEPPETPQKNHQNDAK